MSLLPGYPLYSPVAEWLSGSLPHAYGRVSSQALTIIMATFKHYTLLKIDININSMPAVQQSNALNNHVHITKDN